MAPVPGRPRRCTITDPFLLLDQLGPVEYGPNEAKGAPWHPHRGFETVTYVLDGEIAHHDSNGGGGVIGEGDTQWMTAGGGILHDEVPTERALRDGGPSHGVQLWVNLPVAAEVHAAALPGDHRRQPRAAVVRRRRRARAAHRRRPRRSPGPGRHAHADHVRARDGLARARELDGAVEPGVQRAGVRARRPGLRGRRAAGRSTDHQLVVFGPGDTLTRARRRPPGRAVTDALEVLLLGGLPIREPIAHYGPFVMNTREEILQAVDDFNAGRMGTIPAVDLASSNISAVRRPW